MEEIQHFKEIAFRAIKKAGKHLLEQKNASKKVFEEIGRDLKLEIDRETEKIIRTELKASSLPILGEEFGGEITKNLTWVIDPIDGTANYFKGLDQCCISIALMQNYDSILGIIYDFNKNEIYHAVKSQGAYLNEEKIKVSDIDLRSRAFLTTGFPASETVESSINFLEDLKGWKKVRMFGSAALSCAYVASGKCDYYSEKGVYLWDFAAGICLVEEAGGYAEYSLIDEDRYEVVLSNGLL